MSTSVHDTLPSTTVNVDPEVCSHCSNIVRLDIRNISNQNTFQRRLRHISCIQIRNLTPFPIRDAFASALIQPAEYSQFTPLGNLSDDLDLTISSRKRPRRISVNSPNTIRSTQADTHPSKIEDDDGRGRRRTQSRVSFPGGGSTEPAPKNNAISRTISTSATAPTIRPRNRVRTTSMVSTLGASTANAQPSTSIPQASSTFTTVSSSSLFFDYSQRTLEKVVQSRLVETFISVTVPDSDISSCPSPLIPTTQRTRSESAPRALSSNITPGNNHSATSMRKASKMSRPNSTETSKTPSLHRPEASSSNNTSIPIRKGTTPVKTNGAPLAPRILPRAHKPSASVPPKLTASQLPSPPASPASPEPPPLRAVPNYISPIHPPSTNPSFVIDAQSTFEFAPWTNLSADTMKIELWAKTVRHPISGAPLDGKGKQKEVSVTDRDDSTREGAGWSVLEHWNVTLADLVLLTPEVCSWIELEILLIVPNS
jgi:hypothetical protein